MGGGGKSSGSESFLLHPRAARGHAEWGGGDGDARRQRPSCGADVATITPPRIFFPCRLSLAARLNLRQVRRLVAMTAAAEL